MLGPRERLGDADYGTSASDDVSSDSEARWVSWFCGLKGNEFFCEVDEDFIQDDFNLCSLATQVTYYNYALDTILDVDIPDGELDERQRELVELSAETLYGLIHARFILTARGMNAMLAKFTEGGFGRCPRVLCNGQTVLPVGQSDMPRCSTVKVFCPKCWDLYFPRSRTHNSLDGSFWGTTFPHLFLHTYPTMVPRRNPDKYIPRIYGFKIHPSATQVQINLGQIDVAALATSNGPNGSQRGGTPVPTLPDAHDDHPMDDQVAEANDVVDASQLETPLQPGAQYP